jgi:hypothetical protein
LYAVRAGAESAFWLETVRGRCGAEDLAAPELTPMKPEARSAMRSGKAILYRNQVPGFAVLFTSEMLLNIANLLFSTYEQQHFSLY